MAIERASTIVLVLAVVYTRHSRLRRPTDFISRLQTVCAFRLIAFRHGFGGVMESSPHRSNQTYWPEDQVFNGSGKRRPLLFSTMRAEDCRRNAPREGRGAAFRLPLPLTPDLRQ